MLVVRRFPPGLFLRFALVPMLFGGAWAATVFSLYAVADLPFLRVPFLPIATIGTAVAFYVGFKNNSAYERFWEGRKIWGGVVNASRTWSTGVMSYLGGADVPPEVRRELVYRHLAWVNALRLQLRKSSRFFHKPARWTKRRLERHAGHMRNDWDAELTPFLTPDELESVSRNANPATHLLTTQGQRLEALRNAGQLDLFHQIALMSTVTELYALQGKCERIKNTPFPRQYAEYSRAFTRIFVVLVPFGLLDVFADHLAQATTTLETVAPIVPMVIASALVSWVFGTMEGIGDSSEDPFERSMNDVPMNALARTIEIDLRQMLGETELPPKEQPIEGILY
ncbi:MAG: bestrophin family ion channel [Myxococcota bacterium]